MLYLVPPPFVEFSTKIMYGVGGYGNRVSGWRCREPGNTMSHKGQPNPWQLVGGDGATPKMQQMFRVFRDYFRNSANTDLRFYL